MKAKVVLTLILIVLAATAIAYARTDVVGVATMTTRAARPDEPIALLLSGSTLIAVARALRRLSI